MKVVQHSFDHFSFICTRLSNFPALIAFIASLCLCLVSIHYYGVLNYDALIVAYANQHELSIPFTDVSPALFTFVFDDLRVSYAVMTLLNSVCVFLLIQIGKQMGFDLLTQWSLAFLVCFHLLFNDYRQYLFTAPFYWCMCLLSLFITFASFFSQTQKVILIGVLAYLASGVYSVAWLWVGFLPWLFNLNNLSFIRTRNGFLLVGGYYVVMLSAFFLPHVLSSVSGYDALTTLITSRQTHLVEIGETLSSAWLREDDDLMSFLFLAVGSFSAVLLRTLFSVGIVSLFLIIYGVRKYQFSTVQLWRTRILIALVLMEMVFSTVYLFIQPNYASSAFFVQVLLLLTLSAPGLAYVFRKLQQNRYDKHWQLMIAWLIIGYVMSGLIRFGPSNMYLREAGEAFREQVFVSNHPKVLFYGNRNPLPNSPSLILRDFKDDVWILYRLGRDDVLPQSLQRLKPFRVFQNRHDDKVLVFPPSHASIQTNE